MATDKNEARVPGPVQLTLTRNVHQNVQLEQTNTRMSFQTQPEAERQDRYNRSDAPHYTVA